MDGLDGDHMVLQTVTLRNNRRAVFSMRGRRRALQQLRCTAYLDMQNDLQLYIRR
jgi:hypothetical protein